MVDPTRNVAFKTATDTFSKKKKASHRNIYETAGIKKNKYYEMRTRNGGVDDEYIDMIDQHFEGFKEMFESILEGTYEGDRTLDLKRLEEARESFERAAQEIETRYQRENEALRLATDALRAQVEMLTKKLRYWKKRIEKVLLFKNRNITLLIHCTETQLVL